MVCIDTLLAGDFLLDVFWFVFCNKSIIGTDVLYKCNYERYIERWEIGKEYIKREESR